MIVQEKNFKICCKCNVEQLTSKFHKCVDSKDGLKPQCKLCRKEETRKYIENNYGKEKERHDKYRKNNRDKEIKRKKKWLKNNPNYISKYQKNRILNDPLFRIKRNIRSIVYRIIKHNGYTKKSKTHEIVGCSYDLYLRHIEGQWLLPHNLDENGEVWMSWDNYGKYKKDTLYYGWDIDHIIPVSSAKTKEELLKLFHYTNCQPLCSYTNRYVKMNNYFPST